MNYEFEKTLFYNIVVTEYSGNAELQVDQFCNGITVVNTGTVAMDVNGVPLAPPVAPMLLGEAQSFGGNRNEIFYGRINIGFVAAAGARSEERRVGKECRCRWSP